jgi:hypothetical protein
MPFTIIPPDEPPICDICGKAVFEWWFGDDPIRHDECRDLSWLEEEAE